VKGKAGCLSQVRVHGVVDLGETGASPGRVDRRLWRGGEAHGGELIRERGAGLAPHGKGHHGRFGGLAKLVEVIGGGPSRGGGRGARPSRDHHHGRSRGRRRRRGRRQQLSQWLIS